MDDKNPAAVALGKLGGAARRDKLSAKRQREIALKASRAAKAKRAKAKNHKERR